MNRRRSHKREIANLQHQETHSPAHCKWGLWQDGLKDWKHTLQLSVIILVTRIPPALLALLVMHYLILQFHYVLPVPPTQMSA